MDSEGMTERTVIVPAGRLERWLAGFGTRHGGVVSAMLEPAGLAVTAVDGSTALLEPVAPGWDHEVGEEVSTAAAARSLAGHCTADRPLGLILVRRGGYAVAAARGNRVTASKVGTRYVQSRTSAGGWSQQRFARRRSNQADDLVSAVADHCLGILVPAMPLEFLVTGGDRPLVRDVLRHPRLQAVAALPVADHLAIGDPKAATLAAAAEHAGSVRVRVSQPSRSGQAGGGDRSQDPLP